MKNKFLPYVLICIAIFGASVLAYFPPLPADSTDILDPVLSVEQMARDFVDEMNWGHITGMSIRKDRVHITVLEASIHDKTGPIEWRPRTMVLRCHPSNEKCYIYKYFTQDGT